MDEGNKIKEIRKKKGLTQKQLGERLGVSQTMIAQYENGKRKPKLETLNKIASALDVSVSELRDVAVFDASNLVASLNTLVQSKLDDSFVKCCTDTLNDFENWSEGQRIKILRENANQSQDELAKKTGISKKIIAEYEKNSHIEIPIIDIHKIAIALGTDPENITGLEDSVYQLDDFLEKLGWGILDYNNGNYVLFKNNRYYSMTKIEYNYLEGCILPYLNLRLNEFLEQKKPLTKEQLDQMGLGWLTEP